MQSPEILLYHQGPNIGRFIYTTLLSLHPKKQVLGAVGYTETREWERREKFPFVWF